MEEKKYKIYILKDPRDEQARYVGMTINPRQRIREHLSLNTFGSKGKDAWITEVLHAGFIPTMEIIDEAETESEARGLEGY